MLSLKKSFISMPFHDLYSKYEGVNKKICVVECMTNNFLFLQIATTVGKGAKLILLQLSPGLGHDSFLSQYFIPLLVSDFGMLCDDEEQSTRATSRKKCLNRPS